MSSPKIIFISLKDINSEQMLPQHTKELGHYITWLGKIKQSNPIIISPLISLCLKLSQKISDELNFPISLLRSLSDSSSDEPSSIENLKVLPDSLFPQKFDPLFNFIINNHDLAVIILQESVYSSLKLNAHHRLMDLSCYHELVLQDEKKNEFQINTVNEFEKKILNYIEDKTKNQFEEISEAFNSVKNKLNPISEEVKTICWALNCNFSKSQREFLKSVQQNNQKSFVVLQRTQELLRLTNYYRDLADFFIMRARCSENARVKISAVKLVDGRFQLKIVNKCDEDLRQVQVLMRENMNCVAKVKVLQRFVTVFLDIHIEHSEYFNHLVVVSGDSVVSEPFVLFPLRIEKHAMFATNRLIKVTNLTDKQVQSITIASTQNIENIMHLPKGLLPKQSIFATIPKDDLNKEILLISENQQCSNLLILPS